MVPCLLFGTVSSAAVIAAPPSPANPTGVQARDTVTGTVPNQTLVTPNPRTRQEMPL